MYSGDRSDRADMDSHKKGSVKFSMGNGVAKEPPADSLDSFQDAERFSDTSWQIHRQWRAGDGPSWPVLETPNSNHATGNSHSSWRDHNNGTLLRRTTPPREIQISAPVNYTPTVAKRHSSDEADGPSHKSRQVELSYATERLLVLWLPLQQNDLPRHSQAPGPEREVAQMLNTKHGLHYMVFDVSEQPSRAVMEHPGRVCELGWARGLAPPLERLCALCKHLESWLAADPANVAVLRSCGSRERLAVAVSAYLQYSSICGKQEHALDLCSMKRFLDGSPSLPPSHRRYVEYFSGLLAGGIRVNAAPVWLTHVTVVGAPPLSHVFLKLYEGMVPIYTSNVYSLGSGARQFTAALGPSPAGVAVRGDVLVRCYSRPPPSVSSLHSSLPNRRLLFSCQFHTCAIADYTLIFTKCDLDYACNDENFPPDGSVEIQVSGGRFAPAPTPAVRIVAADDALARYDSLQNLTTVSMTSNTSNTISGANSSGRLSGTSSHHNHNNSSSLSTRTSELAPIARTSDTDDDVNGGRGGEPEGPIYATVARRAAAASNGVQNGSSGSGQARAVSNGAGGPSSPLSASMDSGISSAGRRQGSPSPGAKRRELDDLLRDMMRTVEALPGPAVSTTARNDRERDRPHRSHSSAATDSAPVFSQQPHRSQSSASDIPYHARPDSRPFTYGTPTPDAAMLRCQPGLSSPGLVRKALRPTYKEEDPLDFKINGFNDTQPDSIDGLFTTDANDLYRRRERREALARSPSPSRSIQGVIVNGVPPPLSPVLPRKEHRLLKEETLTTTIRRPGYNHAPSYAGSETPAIRESIEHINGGDNSESDGLTWLQRQQQRLRSRRDARLRQSRLPLDRSMTGRTSASHRFDGYTSDTTAFADDDDDFSIPLHVQTVGRTHAMPTHEPILPNRTSSRRFMSIDRRVMRERSVSPSGVDMLDSPRDPGIMSSHNGTMTREESLSSWRSVSVSEWEGADGELESRGGTPAFPTTPRTPYPAPHTPPNRLPPRSPVAQRKDYSTMLGRSPSSPHPPTTPVTPELQDVSPELVKFVKDTSKFWYKPNISRDEAIALLQTQDTGAFIIRDSNSFPNAFGLALKVAAPPGASLGSIDLVRHFLIEPTSRGVRLKGCADEPVFSSLSALVYQHSVTPLALPARLKLPGSDPAPPGPAGAARALLATGAACSVLYIGGSGCEALTGPEAITRTAAKLFAQRPDITPAIVHFKVSPAGITLTDSARRLFFRRHYPTSAVSFCGLDPGDRRWNHKVDANGIPSPNRMFGFIARRTGSSTDNECHIFAELEPEQPATAIVNFVSKVMLGQTPPQNIV